MGLTCAESLIFLGNGEVALKQIELPPPQTHEVLAQAICSGISPGTERLVLQGEIEAGVPMDATIEELAGEHHDQPFRYGYSWVGKIQRVGLGVEQLAQGDTVFAFAPHQSHHLLKASSCTKLPEGLSPTALTLLPAMETALSVVHDAAPLAGENIVIFGQGLVGLCVAWLFTKFPLGGLHGVEPCPERRKVALKLGLHSIGAELPTTHEKKADLVVELSGSPLALESAIHAAAPHGRVVVASWYGTRRTPMNFSTHFHRGRIQLLSSQVSSIPPAMRGLWTHKRRLARALLLLAEFPTELLSQREIPFCDSPHAYSKLLTESQGPLHPLFIY